MKVKAIVATTQGGSEVLRPQEIDLVWPNGEHDVLVELHTASVNPADIYFRTNGAYVRPDSSLVLGHDGMGVVVSTGPRVTSVQKGDRVCFCNGGIGGVPGTYAEAAIVPEWQLAKVPDSVDDVTAAALPLVSITAWEALYERAAVSAGDWTLIHGGAGGTGHVAIQLAVVRGARVATTVSSSGKSKLVENLGAELAINYRETDFVAEVLKGSGGVAIALDNVGGSTLVHTFKAMRPYGQVVTLMGLEGDTDLVAYNANITVHNVMMLTPMWWGLTERLKQQAEIVRKALVLVEQGLLSIHVSNTFPLASVREAHTLFEKGGVTGKVVLHIQ